MADLNSNENGMIPKVKHILLPRCKVRNIDLKCWILAILVVSQFTFSLGFNLDTSAPIVYTHPDTRETDTYFGYSVLLHQTSTERLVLVGAPKSNSGHQLGLERPGAVFRCSAGRTGGLCRQVLIDNAGNERSAPGTKPLFADAKDNQWLGVSLSRQDRPDGRVVTCGHRWANHYFRDTVHVILPNGACYFINADLEFESVNKSKPCLHEVQIKADNLGKGIAWHGWCQAGFSARYSMDGDTLMLGAVGSLAWRGSVISITDSAGSNVADVSPWYPAQDKDESYIGYSVTSGYFQDTRTVQGATGAPRAYERGQVYIYDLRSFALISEIHGPGMNTYFGAAVLGFDINGDGLSDLLVGAPLFSTTQDEGRVYVYINEGNAVFVRDVELTGSGAIRARFGSVIEDAGDLNMDEHPDVIIGAPYEDDQAGAVYIYHGSPMGLRNKYTQRITPSSFTTGPLRSFGHSLSGGMDMDYNGYPDIVVGAYQDGRAALFLSQPVITMRPLMALSPEPIDLIQKDCVFQGKKVSCVKVSTCFDYLGHGVPSSIAIDLLVEADHFKAEQGFNPRVEFMEKGRSVGTAMRKVITLTSVTRKCIKNSAMIKNDVKDFLSPIPFKLTYSLRTQRNSNGSTVTQCDDLCPVIDMYSPNNVIKTISFIHNCGNDSKCETDLQLKASLVLQRRLPYLPHGVDMEFQIKVDLYNNGEEAHQARVMFTLPQEVSFINVKSDALLETLVWCTPEDNHNSTLVKLVCDVDNPMAAYAKSKFIVKFGVNRLHHDITALHIGIEANTSSIEHNNTKQDNYRDILIPVKVEADITVNGVTRPESIVYKNKREKGKEDVNVRNETNDGMDVDVNLRNNISIQLTGPMSQMAPASIGPAFKHIYNVRNLGPSFLPLETTVNISFPWRRKDGIMLTYVQNVQFSGAVSCHEDVVNRRQSGLLDMDNYNASMSRWADEESAPAIRPLTTLNCDTVECLYLVCTVSTLETGGGAVIEVQARIWEENFRNIYKDHLGSVQLTSEVQLSVNNTGNRHIQPREHFSDSDKVMTTIYSEAAVKPKSVSKWLIALGVIFGLFGLVALVLFLAKMGFFKRSMKEEMERLIKEKDDILENLNGEVMEDEEDGYDGDNAFFKDS